MFFATLLGLDIHKRFPFRFDNTSVSKVDFSQRRPRICLLNDTCHLRMIEYQAAVVPQRQHLPSRPNDRGRIDD